jgi:hypothetical protein
LKGKGKIGSIAPVDNNTDMNEILNDLLNLADSARQFEALISADTSLILYNELLNGRIIEHFIGCYEVANVVRSLAGSLPCDLGFQKSFSSSTSIDKLESMPISATPLALALCRLKVLWL